MENKLHPAQRSAQGKMVTVSVPFFQENSGAPNEDIVQNHLK